MIYLSSIWMSRRASLTHGYLRNGSLAIPTRLSCKGKMGRDFKNIVDRGELAKTCSWDPENEAISIMWVSKLG